LQVTVDSSIIPANTLENIGDYIRITYTIRTDITDGPVPNGTILHGAFIGSESISRGTSTTPYEYAQHTIEMSYKGLNSVFVSSSSYAIQNVTGNNIAPTNALVNPNVTFNPGVDNTLDFSVTYALFSPELDGEVYLENLKIEKLRI